jgi:hypothetical protein
VNKTRLVIIWIKKNNLITFNSMGMRLLFESMALPFREINAFNPNMT